MKYLLFLLPLLTLGCTSAKYRVIEPGVTREFELIRPFYNTKIGDLEVTTPDGVKVHLKDLDSQERGSQIFEKLVDKIPNAPVVVP